MTPYSQLAAWSPWLPLIEAWSSAPRQPGVYLARIDGGLVVYVGMAGDLRGAGLRGRLRATQLIKSVSDSRSLPSLPGGG